MTIPERLSSVKRGLVVLEWAWMALILLFLPITSLPLLAQVGKLTLVSPPTLLLVGIFALVWLPVYVFRKRGALPREAVPLIFFTCIALIASLAAFFLPLPTYKGISFSSETIQAIITLAGGVVCYFVFATWFRAQKRFRFAFILINLTGLAIIGWCLLQAYVIYFLDGNYPPFMIAIQSVLSVRSLEAKSFSSRVTGFAYEPSWLAHQLNVLYLPYWLAATVSGYSAFRRRLGRVSAENILCVACFFVMVGSLSRIGLLSFLIVVFYLFLRLNTNLAGWLKQRFTRRNKKTVLDSRWGGSLIGIGLLLLYGLLAFALVFIAAQVDERLARIFNLSRIPASFFELARSMAFAERVGYWSVGWRVLARYPLLGVGLGNTGFFYSKYVLLAARDLTELARMEFQFSLLPNVKNLWIRILSETGIIGFSLFASWLYMLWKAARALNWQDDKFFRMAGWMGLFTILALLGEGFSIDSFALPYYWVSLGLLTAASFMLRLQGATAEDLPRARRAATPLPICKEGD